MRFEAHEDVRSTVLNARLVRRLLGHPWRLVLPCLLLVAAIGGHLYMQRQSGEDAAYRTLVNRQILLAQNVANEAAKALVDARAASAALRRLQAATVIARRRLEAAPPPLEAGASGASIDARRHALTRAWRDLDAGIDTLLESQPPAERLVASIEEIRLLAAGILVNADRLVSALVVAEAPLEQIHVAARQLMLIQRVTANARRLQEGHEGALSAADRLGRDALAFGDVNNALLSGSRELHVQRVEDEEARAVLEMLGRGFRQALPAIEGVMQGAGARTRLTEAVKGVVGAGERVAAAGQGLARTHEASIASRRIQPRMIDAIGVVALLSLLLAGLYLARDARLLGREVRRVQQASRRLAEEWQEREAEFATTLERVQSCFEQLGDGDFTVASPVDTPTAGPLVSAALERLRARIRAARESVSELSVQREGMHEAASNLADAGRQHAEQVETTAKSTRDLAVTVDEITAGGESLGLAVSDAASGTAAAADAARVAVEDIDVAVAAMNDTAVQVRRLSESAESVRELMRLVDDLGDMSKMLSLNVAIQASMDTEAGRALTHFSDEVQHLGDRARLAMRRIDAVNEGVRGAAEGASGAIKRGLWSAARAAERAGAAGAPLEQVRATARRFEQLNQSLGEACRVHSLQLTEVVRAVASVHGTARQIEQGARRCADLSSRFGSLCASFETRLESFRLPAHDASVHDLRTEDEEAAPELPDTVVALDPRAADQRR